MTRFYIKLIEESKKRPAMGWRGVATYFI